MNFARDNYVVLAGDTTAVYCGRAWGAEEKSWYTVTSPVDMPSGRLPREPLILRSADIRVLIPAGNGIKTGIRILGMVITDPLATGTVAILFDKVQSTARLATWHGEFPLEYGFQWRIAFGGLATGDIVTCSLGYERRKL